MSGPTFKSEQYEKIYQTIEKVEVILNCVIFPAPHNLCRKEVHLMFELQYAHLRVHCCYAY